VYSIDVLQILALRDFFYYYVDIIRQLFKYRNMYLILTYFIFRLEMI